jgi:diacylglycerol O-acyltransferase / wax synthase
MRVADRLPQGGDRMNPLDASFLHIEDGITHMHIGSCAVFEGPPPALEEVRRLFASKLPLVPRYRQRVRFVPFDLGRPVWVDDPYFNLDFHMRHTALPSPGGEEALRNLMGRVMSQELDRDRPLWETWVVEGLDDHRWAIISKVHHCMIDGVAGVDLISLVLDPEPRPAPDIVDDWSPSPEPSGAVLAAGALVDLARSPYEQYRALRSSLRSPRRAIERARNVAEGLGALAGGLLPTPASTLEGAIGPHRRWVPARTTLDEIRVIRRALGGTVNDVVLAAISNGFRDLVLARGEDPSKVEVRSLIPVSVRTEDARGLLDNRVAAMFLRLPIGVAEPDVRLAEVRARMERLKASHEAEAAEALVSAAGATPAFVVGPTMRAAARALQRMPQWLMNTVTTNVPGPQLPLYAAGREMIEYLPYVPLGPGVRTGVAILSYNGKVAFGVTGDWDTAADIDVLARGIEDGIGELLKLAEGRTAA